MPLVMPIYGTRPEAIKMAPIVRAIRDTTDLDCRVVVTGQHRSMLDQVNDLFDITVDDDLDIFQQGQTLNGILSKTIAGIDALLVEHKPDIVLVQGDTTTSTAGALAAFYHRIPVVHVEAGLRSGDINSPYPEEANRRITSQIASLHLAPTDQSRDNLLAEGISSKDIVVTGNSVIDALLEVAGRSVTFTDERLNMLQPMERRVVLVTTHRRENQGSIMTGIGRAIAKLADKFLDVDFVLPLHKNPAVRDAVIPEVEGSPNVIVTEPLGYAEFTRLLGLSCVVLTDSGGVQEEAPSLGKPVLVMRENTERPEAVEAGTVRLIGTAPDSIVNGVSQLLEDSTAYDSMAAAVNPYGDGQAAPRTVAAVRNLLNMGDRLPEFVYHRSAQRGAPSLEPALQS
ncbi:non-hydrolyzing UDP-N-acetylglucosamine 2-epimerase [Arthrobacter sp. ISL-72]|uniref:non-hydrolyzing UDP-N-acetylglucosamine 2-epimerase n=1 Tax=Arthrobacter sp. ISL-72 TaxID=2819114 RepID=UPI001BEA209E|nr:UDP-N-acetylglucosamine 2-epimerase (non-hydrolyzing) [Arthrobacter sp. ISL-72]MBT2596619.1 UDP-N-acetylglucosamine 2-epimerase (non-hydrolyzing) [Arthrobacter sp. ISL-72]